MINLENINLIDLQTTYMQNDLVTRAICEVLNPIFKELANETKLAFFYGRIDELDHNILDELAWQFKVDFYSVDYPLNVKRNLIKNAKKIHKTRGTPAAVENLLSSIFGKATLYEWFEYGGEPYFFKVKVEVENNINLLLEKFEESLVNVKNCRSHLEKIEIYSVSKNKTYLGSTTLIGESVSIFPWMPKEIRSKGQIFTTISGSYGLETTNIYPKEVKK